MFFKLYLDSIIAVLKVNFDLLRTQSSLLENIFLSEDRIDKSQLTDNEAGRCRLEFEVATSVVITNILYNFACPFYICRQLAIFDIFGK